MPSAILYQRLDGSRITGINPKDIQERALPQRRETKTATDRLIDKVMEQRKQANYNPNQVIYFSDVARRLLAD